MQEKLVRCPFTIVVDTAEKEGHAWTFRQIRTDADKDNAIFVTHLEHGCLGRHPYSLGDYTIVGGYKRVAIERKSKEDAWGTILGWPTGYEQDRGLPGRRDRFERELENLNQLESACVIVEATLGTCVHELIDIERGVKPGWQNSKIFFRSVLSYQQRFPRVQWMFLDDARMAEVAAFRWFYRFWEKNLKPKRKNKKYFVI
jgi:hypothetical protein